MTNAEEEHGHAHSYVEVCRSENILVVEEVAHQLLTLHLYDRGLALDLTREEARELASVLADVDKYMEESSGAS